MSRASIGMLRKDGTPTWLYETLRRLIDQSQSAQQGLSAITRGEVPDGSGNPLSVDLSKFYYLPGRANGQIGLAIDTAPPLTLQSVGGDSSTLGSIGNPAFRLSRSTTTMLEFRPYLFSAGQYEPALMASSTAGAKINIPANDGTQTALRFTAEGSRGFIQAGLRNAGGSIVGADMTIGGAGASTLSSLLGNTAIFYLTNGTTPSSFRVGFGAIDPRDYSAGGWTSVLTVGFGTTTNVRGNAPISAVVATAGATQGQAGFLLRGPFTGTTPNQVLGSPLAAIENSCFTISGSTSAGAFTVYQAGVRIGGLTTSGSGGNPCLVKISDAGTTPFQPTGVRCLEFSNAATLWADDGTNLADSVALALGDSLSRGTDTNKKYAIFTGQGFNVLDRLGITATSTVVGPISAFSLPAPVSSRLWTFVDSGGVVLSGFTSAGALFFVSGAASGRILQSDANGVGSWFNLFGTANTWTTTQTITPATDVLGLKIDMANLSTANGLEIYATGGILVFDIQASGIFEATNPRFHNGFIGSGADVTIDLSLLTASRTAFMPDAGGTFVLNNNSQALANKSINSGAVSLATQSADITATPITVTPSTTNGVYFVEVILMCTTLDAGAGSLTVTIGWTDTVGATTQAVVADPGSTAFPLPLTATGRAYGHVLLRHASGNVTYAVAGGGTYGAARYSLIIRVLNLG